MSSKVKFRLISKTIQTEGNAKSLISTECKEAILNVTPIDPSVGPSHPKTATIDHKVVSKTKPKVIKPKAIKPKAIKPKAIKPNDLRLVENRRKRRFSKSGSQVLVNGWHKIHVIAESMHLRYSCHKNANKVLEEYHEEYHPYMRYIDAIASACVYIACRLGNNPVALREIAAISGVKSREIGRYMRKVCQRMGIYLEGMTADQLIPRFCGRLDLPNTVTQQAIDIAAISDTLNGSHNPISVAAAAIYMVSQTSDLPEQKRSIKDIVSLTHTTYQTLKKVCQHLIPHLSPAYQYIPL